MNTGGSTEKRSKRLTANSTGVPGAVLNPDPRYVPDLRQMSYRGPIGARKARDSFGSHLLDHLTADRTCLTGGEFAVVALLEVNTDLVCGLHLELLESSLCFGDYDLVGRHDFSPSL